MKKKFLLILMMLIAFSATMSAQEQTDAPVVTCEFDEIGYATIIIDHDDPEAEIYYRFCYYGPDYEENWTDWMFFSGPFCFQEAGEYEVQAYAISPGKSASDCTLQHISVRLSETEAPVIYESEEHDGDAIINIIHNDPWATIYYKIIELPVYFFDFPSSEPGIPDEPDEWNQYYGPIDIHAGYSAIYVNVYVWAAAVSPGRPQSETVFSMLKVERPFTTAAPSVYAHHVDADKGLALRIIDGIALENNIDDMNDFYYSVDKMPAQYFHYKIDDADEWTELTDEYLYLKEYGDYTITTYASSDMSDDSEQDIAIVSYRPDSFGSRDGYRIVYDGVVYRLNENDTTTVSMSEKYWDGMHFYDYPGIYPVKSNDVIPETFTIHDNEYTVTGIGCGALWNFTNVRIPKTITYINILGSSYYDYFYSLEHDYTSISVDEENHVYDSRNNCNAVVETATNTLILGCSNTVIPSTVTAIGNHAFNGCGGMTSVTIGNSVTSIGERAFWHCSGLTRLTIGNSVTSIGDEAFMNCYNLTSIISKPTIAPAISYNAFYNYSSEGNVYEQAKLFVPAESLETYRAHEVWGQFGRIVPFIGAGPGDINGDGNIAISDVTRLIDMLLSGDELPAWADVNGDGAVTISDVTTLIDILLGGN